MKISLPEYEVAKRSNVMVAMRDGARLAIDLYFPTQNGNLLTDPLPAIMERTPYDKQRSALRGGTAEYFASRGYVVIYQDTRGRFKSEGEFVKYLSEPNDGYDMLVWIGD